MSVPILPALVLTPVLRVLSAWRITRRDPAALALAAGLLLLQLVLVILNCHFTSTR